MVRTQPGISPIRFDTSRILAYSTAIALHALAAGLLLIPLSQVPVRSDAVRQEPRWQLPEIVPVAPTPPPPVPVTVPVVRQPPPPTQHALPAPVDNAPMPVFATEAVIPQQAGPATPSDAIGPVADSIAPATPLAGVQLRYLHAPAPAYPRDALRAGAQGTVTLRVLVGVDGSPLEVSIERSSGNRSLDTAARAQVLRQWKFQPAMDNGRPVQAYGLVPVDFKLN